MDTEDEGEHREGIMVEEVIEGDVVEEVVVEVGVEVEAHERGLSARAQ